MSYKSYYYHEELKITQSMRESIYEDVWSEPLYKVATKYHTTGATLRKRCRECWDIPVPYSGYWASVRAGKKEKRMELPMPPAKSARSYLSGYAISYIQLEDVPEAELYTQEPLFVFSERTKHLLAIAEKDLRVPTVIKDPRYDIAGVIESAKIKKGTVQYRGLCILYALSEKVGEFEGGDYLGDSIKSGHLFSGFISLCHQDWCYHMNCDAKTKRLSLSFFWSEWGYDYGIHPDEYSIIFADKEDLPLEQQLGAVFHALMVESGKKIQEEELERRAEIIRKANEEKAKKLKPFIDKENEKVEKALKDADAYNDAQKIRAYAEAYYEKNSPLFDTCPKLKEHYDWLKERADWLDPLIENDYDRFLSPQ